MYAQESVKPEFSGGAGLMAPTAGFRERLAFLRWLRNQDFRVPEPDKAFAREVGVGYSWLKKWMKRPDAPTVRKGAGALLAGLQRLGIHVSDAWLLDGDGDPPFPPNEGGEDSMNENLRRQESHRDDRRTDLGSQNESGSVCRHDVLRKLPFVPDVD